MNAAASRSFDAARMFAPLAAVEAHMAAFIDQRPLPENLRQAAKYALFGPGKRMRPLLVMRACEAVGGPMNNALPPAAAIEMIHCFSLVHDDLPAMDDDDLRRGRPTLHKHTNEAMAILAGDLLMGLAFEIVAQQMEGAASVAVLRELALGTNNMIAGQVYDTLPDFPDAMPPIERLRTIHRNKTGALIRSSCRMGAMAGGADDAHLESLSRYGDAIGLMFQVMDDILDVTQSTEQLGKTAGKDVAQNKLTYPALIGLEASRAEVTRLHAEANAALESLGSPAEPLRELCDFMAVRIK